MSATPPAGSADMIAPVGEVERAVLAERDGQPVWIDEASNITPQQWENVSEMLDKRAEQRGYDRAIAEVVAWLREHHDGRLVSRIYLATAIEAGEHKS